MVLCGPLKGFDALSKVTVSAKVFLLVSFPVTSAGQEMVLVSLVI